MARTVLILNPAARGGGGGVEAVEQWAADRDVVVRRTEARGDAERFARDAASQGSPRVVVAAGDGTVREVVEGLCSEDGTTSMAIVPLGTGNDAARAAGIPLEVEEALELAEGGVAHPVDVVRATSRQRSFHFLNAATGGVSRGVRRRLTRRLKRWLGPLAYVVAAVGALRRVRWYRATFHFDGEVLETRVCHVTIANGRCVAGGLMVAPDALLDDGRLDVTVFTADSYRQRFALALRYFLGTYHRSPSVVYRRVRRIEVESSPPLSFNIDGEPDAATPVVFEVQPGALPLVVGPLAATTCHAQEGPRT